MARPAWRHMIFEHVGAIWRYFRTKIKFREKTLPRLRQAGESFSLNLIP